MIVTAAANSEVSLFTQTGQTVNELLAIDGGQPLAGDLDFAWPPADPAVSDAVQAALRDGTWGQYEARWTEQLKQALKHQFGRQRAMLCCSGTLAVELALRAVGVRAGDEVILAAYDFPGNFRAVEAIGAVPVLVDLIPGGWSIDPGQLEDACSDQTRAILFSHLHGQVSNLDDLIQAITQIRKSWPIAWVEDACQVPGGRWRGSPLGSFADVSALSFGGSKLLSAGRGGALLTDDESILQRARIFVERGNDAFPMSQLQAATLPPQLDRLDELTRIRADAARQLSTALSDLPGLQPGPTPVPEALPAYYKLGFRWTLESERWTRESWIAAVRAEGVPIGAGFRGFARRSGRRCRKPLPLPNATSAAADTVLLHHPVLLASANCRERVVAAISRVSMA